MRGSITCVAQRFRLVVCCLALPCLVLCFDAMRCDIRRMVQKFRECVRLVVSSRTPLIGRTVVTAVAAAALEGNRFEFAFVSFGTIPLPGHIVSAMVASWM